MVGQCKLATAGRGQDFYSSKVFEQKVAFVSRPSRDGSKPYD